MRVVIQRVKEASVSVGDELVSRIAKGLLVLLAIETDDGEQDARWLCGKIARLRIFNDPQGVMNLSVREVSGSVLLVSQFTLFASTRKGNRPSYARSCKSETAIPLYEKFIEILTEELEGPVLTGRFGADMAVSLINDGPVTILIDSKLKE